MPATRSVLPARRTATLLLAAAAALIAATASPADAQGPVVRIEEDWVLEVAEPNAEILAPQSSTFMSPYAEFSGVYFGTLLNHAAADEFQPGGFQVVAFNEGGAKHEVTSLTRQPLNFPYEEIRWTQALAVRNNVLAFAIKNGTSDSWGDFGGSETMLQMAAPGLSDLSGYTPAASLAAAEVGFGRNRVVRMRLLEVRYIEEDGTVRRESVDAGPK